MVLWFESRVVRISYPDRLRSLHGAMIWMDGQDRVAVKNLWGRIGRQRMYRSRHIHDRVVFHISLQDKQKAYNPSVIFSVVSFVIFFISSSVCV